MKKRILIYGAGSTGERCYNILMKNNDIEMIGFLDNDLNKKGDIFIGKKIIGDINSLTTSQYEYDEIVVASLSGYKIIFKQLVDAGVPHKKINTSLIETMVQARINFLKEYSEIVKNYMFKNRLEDYACAEGGVYQGEFAKLINNYFPTNKLYLFDTFEGFYDNDLKNETERKEYYIEKHQSNTSVELVLSKMEYRDNVIIKKGVFPDSLVDMPDEKYIFVNLDFDLYDPTIAGLNYFYGRMVKGGIILIHDYFNEGYPGVKRAVLEFKETNKDAMFIPIGDECSVAIIKH